MWNAAVEPDSSVFHRKERIVMSMLSVGVNMGFRSADGALLL